MHIATRGNNKILRTPPPHISSSEEILSRLTRRTLAQQRTNKSPFLKSYLHKVHAKSHPSPLCPLCNTQHTLSLQQLHPHTHHVVTPGFVDRPHWSYGSAGQMDGEAGWWTTSRGSRNKQQHCSHLIKMPGNEYNRTIIRITGTIITWRIWIIALLF